MTEPHKWIQFLTQTNVERVHEEPDPPPLLFPHKQVSVPHLKLLKLWVHQNNTASSINITSLSQRWMPKSRVKSVFNEAQIRSLDHGGCDDRQSLFYAATILESGFVDWLVGTSGPQIRLRVQGWWGWGAGLKIQTQGALKSLCTFWCWRLLWVSFLFCVHANNVCVKISEKISSGSSVSVSAWSELPQTVLEVLWGHIIGALCIL